MRILVVGAGGIGGYFGARLLQAGGDVTFLVRPRRAERLADAGLVVRSPKGDVHHPAPRTILSDQLREPFDLIVVSCKAYDLDAAIDSVAPAVGERTAILPLLNGMRHLDVLDRRFGEKKVLGGLCMISAMLDPEGTILHLNDLHFFVYGERDGSRSARIEAIEEALAPAAFDARASDAIVLEMWEKWVFIAATAGITCLMRSGVGDIVAAGGAGLASALLGECAAIAAAAGFAPREIWIERFNGALTQAGSPLAASMFRDIEAGGRTEAEHVIGDLLGRAGEGVATPILRIADTHLRTYEARRAREGGG